QDAAKQGRPHWQMSSNKDTYYQLITQHVFTNDRDPAVKQAYLDDPLSFVKTIKGCFAKLKTKYNAINRQLGLLGAGVTIEQLLEDPQKQNLYEWLQPTFLWWDNLHGWWKDNPSFNHSFSTADPGQDFIADACSHFSQ
ncbi:hypothetical protein PISMIDRAFT_74852, partial [Pisolithus microcarpus 441]